MLSVGFGSEDDPPPPGVCQVVVDRCVVMAGTGRCKLCCREARRC